MQLSIRTCVGLTFIAQSLAHQPSPYNHRVSQIQQSRRATDMHKEHAPLGLHGNRLDKADQCLLERVQ